MMINADVKNKQLTFLVYWKNKLQTGKRSSDPGLKACWWDDDDDGPTFT